MTICAVALGGLLLSCEQSDEPQASKSSNPKPDRRGELAAAPVRGVNEAIVPGDGDAFALIPSGVASAGARGTSSTIAHEAVPRPQITLGEGPMLMPQQPDDSISWNNCLEPLGDRFSEYAVVHRALDFPPENALAVMVFTPVLEDQPRVLSLHKGSARGFYTRVVRMDSTPSERSRFERPLDTKTAELLERVWSALLARTRRGVAEELWCCLGDQCGSVELMQGRRAGSSAMPGERGSTTHLATDSAMALARLTEHPEPGDQKELIEIRKRLRLALDRALTQEACGFAPIKSPGESPR